MQGSYDGEAYAAEKAYYAEVAKAADTRQATKVVPEKGGPIDGILSLQDDDQVFWFRKESTR